MRADFAFIAGVGLGASLTFVLDPDRGARRRALVRDKVARAVRETGRSFGERALDLKQRARGMAATLRPSQAPDSVSPELLTARVRAKLGRVVSHPRSIEVEVTDGVVRLAGPILTSERWPLLSAVASVPGVVRVDDQLEAHDEPGAIPGLQGNSRKARQQPAWAITAGLAAVGLALAAGAVTSLAATDLPSDAWD
jgi:hypothetical protein